VRSVQTIAPGVDFDHDRRVLYENRIRSFEQEFQRCNLHTHLRQTLLVSFVLPRRRGHINSFALHKRQLAITNGRTHPAR
jgi:hypothetical protein